MCTYFLHSIHPTTLFPNTFFLSLVPAPPLVRTCSTFLFSDFVKEKREKETNKQTNKLDILACLDKGSYPGSFLVIFA
jgi:hypothetical protein